MGFLDLFKKQDATNQSRNLFTDGLPEMPEKVFVEKDTPITISTQEGNRRENNINLLLDFIDKSYEDQGFNDALINPDSKNLEDNIHSFELEFQRVLGKVRVFYQDIIQDIDLHILMRSRSGMVDLVDELETKKKKAESHLQIVQEIEAGTYQAGKGYAGIVLSYTRGFKNAMAAISLHVINQKF